MNIFPRYAIYVGGGDLLYSSAVSLQEIWRVTVELIRHALAQHLLFGIKRKDKGIQDGIFGLLYLFIFQAIFQQFGNLFVERLDGGRGAAALGSHSNAEDSRMIESRPNPAAYAIS